DETPSRDKKPLASYSAGGRVRGLALHPTEGWLACSVTGERVHFLSGQTLQPLRPPLPWPAGRARFLPEGDLVLTGNGQLHFLNRYQRAAGATSAEAGTDRRMDELAVSPDGVLLATSCQRTRQVRRGAPASGGLLAELPAEDGPLKLAFAPAARRLAVTAESHTRLYELARRGAQAFIASGPETILAGALPPDGGSLACLTRC